MAGAHLQELRPFEDAPDLPRQVAHFLAAGLAVGELVVVVASSALRGSLRSELDELCFDVDRACASGRLVFMPVDETITAIVRDDDVPDQARFESLFRPVTGRRAGARPGVRVYSEMSHVLAERGSRGVAVQLENLWVDLAQRCGFSLRVGSLHRSGTTWGAEGGTAPRTEGSGALESEVRLVEEPSRPRLDEARHDMSIEMLSAISAVLNSELDLDALMQKLTDEATKACRADFGSFFYNVVSDANQRYMLYTLSGAPRASFAGFPMPRKTPLFEPTFDGNGVVRIDDVTKDPRYAKNPPYDGMPVGHLPVRSYLAVPVKSRSGEVLGALLFGHTKPGVFTAADERLLVAVGTHAAIAIENARLLQKARRAEQAAETERSKLHGLFMQTPAAIWIVRGPELLIDFANPVARHLFSREVTGKPIGDVLADSNERLFEPLQRVYTTGERFVGTEVPYAPGGPVEEHRGERFFNVVHEPYLNESGGVEGVMSFCFEVTEQVLSRRKTESFVDELERAHRAKDEFLATVSHELRTPLHGMLGWVRMMRSGMLPPERHERALETIERNANAQTQLIEDLLDVSRIISGKMRLVVGEVDLSLVIDHAIEAVRPAAAAKGVTIRQTIDPLVQPIIGDKNRLQQVVWNLVNNAVKFTPVGGWIRIVLSKLDSAVEILVQDSGQGIDRDFLPYVFERFRQADGATTRKHGGLGLGLSIVRHLVELHGGQAKVDSEGRGKGATFVVRLPTAPHRCSLDHPPPLRLVARTPNLSYPPELMGLRFLIVEDEPDARDLLVQVLEPCGETILTAANASDGLRLVEDGRPDVIISDIGLPGEDGYAFIKNVRALPATRGGRTPAIALTAYARVEDRTKALGAGFQMHVPKPVEPSELMAVLASLVTIFPKA